MTDKERILSLIIQRFYPSYILGLQYRGNCKFSYFSSDNQDVTVGDLVVCTTCRANEFLVGFVTEIIDSSQMIIREIGSKRTCNISNESFCKIDTENLGYELLEVIQYKIYQKVLKAFSDYASYSTRFRSIEFNGDECVITSRMMFSNDITGSYSFKYNAKTTIKEIGSLLKDK